MNELKMERIPGYIVHDSVSTDPDSDDLYEPRKYFKAKEFNGIEKYYHNGDDIFPDIPKESSTYRGVSWYKSSRKWQATIRISCQKIHLGYFNNELEAAQAYDRKIIESNLPRVKYRLNFPDEDLDIKTGHMEALMKVASEAEAMGAMKLQGAIPGSDAVDDAEEKQMSVFIDSEKLNFKGKKAVRILDANQNSKLDRAKLTFQEREAIYNNSGPGRNSASNNNSNKDNNCGYNNVLSNNGIEHLNSISTSLNLSLPKRQRDSKEKS